MIGIVRIVFAAAALAFAWFSIALDGSGLWSGIATAGALLVLSSLFLPMLDVPARVIVRLAGILALLAVALTLLAATIGGGFNISPEVQPLMACLVVLALLTPFDRKPRS
jgi:hypothetical protein